MPSAPVPPPAAVAIEDRKSSTGHLEMQGDDGERRGGKGTGDWDTNASRDSRIIDALARGGMIAGDGADDGDGEAARITMAESNGMFRRMDRNGDGL